MANTINRRMAIATVISAPLAAQQADKKAEPARPAPQAPDLVLAFVRAGHGDKNLEKVKEMLAETPKLVFATWDWGGGDWETALGGASHTGSRVMAKYLLSQGARIDSFCAAMLGYRDVLTALVAANSSVVTAKGPHGFTLLYHAASSGDIAMAELLKPHLAAQSKDYNQALSAAVRDGHLAMTKWLLENGVTDPNLPDGLGKRTLQSAREKGLNEIADELKKHGATER